jgi:replicative DNA helicase
MAEADLFVILDHVQFERRNYQNRTMIRLEDEARWLTVPVVQLSQKEKIIDKRVDNPPDLEGNRWWGPNSFNTLKYAYRKAPYFESYAAELRDIFHAKWDKLVDLDMAGLEFLRKHLEIATPLVKSSTLCPEGQRSELLLDICQRVKASTFLGGMGGSRTYLNQDAFDRVSMGVKWQDFKHPVYPQQGAAPFIKGLSALDLLFNCGPRSAEILRGAQRKANDELLAAA